MICTRLAITVTFLAIKSDRISFKPRVTLDHVLK
jgi:hypothetical protein